MTGTTEAFARVRIDALLADAGWNLTDGASVLFEYLLPDGTLADYVLCDRQGRPLAALEAKRASVDPILAQDQGRHYAVQLGVPFVFLSNGEEVWFLDREADAHARRIAGFHARDDLERRIAARSLRRDLATVDIDCGIVDRDYRPPAPETIIMPSWPPGSATLRRPSAWPRNRQCTTIRSGPVAGGRSRSRVGLPTCGSVGAYRDRQIL